MQRFPLANYLVFCTHLPARPPTPAAERLRWQNPPGQLPGAPGALQLAATVNLWSTEEGLCLAQRRIPEASGEGPQCTGKTTIGRRFFVTSLQPEAKLVARCAAALAGGEQPALAA